MKDANHRVRRIPSGLRSELRESAWNHGYRRETGEADGWLFFASDLNVPGEIALAVADSGAAWFLAVEHAGVAAELKAEPAAPVPGCKRAAWGFDGQPELRAAIQRTYNLSRSLPSAPLLEYQAETEGLGDTEVERLRKERVGQEVFRRALLRFWDGRCPLTGIAEPELLRASHIVAWADCSSDAERLSVFNGLLLAAHLDAAFDAGLISFGDSGEVLVKPSVSNLTRHELGIGRIPPLPLTSQHQLQLEQHRERHGFQALKADCLDPRAYHP